MKSNTKQLLLEFIKDYGASSPNKLAELLKISPRAVHKHLRDLLLKGQIIKRGSAPHVFYEIAPTEKKVAYKHSLSKTDSNFIEENFSRLLPSGNLIQGLPAFESWLESTKQIKSYDVLAQSYIKLHKEIANKKTANNFYDLSEKVNQTFDHCSMQKMFCSDFYSLPQFGKTYLGNLITAGKSGQDRASIEKIVKIVSTSLIALIKEERIDALAWVPHSIPRKTLFLPLFKKLLDLELPEIKLIKVYSGGIPVAQKSLSKLEDRITNAKETILIKSTPSKASKILIIDDALGSGATMNEIALKLENKLHPKLIVGYAVVGSYKGFDVLGVV